LTYIFLVSLLFNIDDDCNILFEIPFNVVMPLHIILFIKKKEIAKPKSQNYNNYHLNIDNTTINRATYRA
jgi:hypothetical protein